MVLSVSNLKKLLKFPECYNFQLEREFIFQMSLILLFLCLLFSCCPSFPMLCVGISDFSKPYKLSFFLLGAISLSLPTRISVVQTGVSDENSRDGVLTPQEWHGNTRVAIGNWRWLWKFINTISVDLKLIKCNYKMNEIVVNDRVCWVPKIEGEALIYSLTVHRLVGWLVCFTCGIPV